MKKFNLRELRNEGAELLKGKLSDGVKDRTIKACILVDYLLENTELSYVMVRENKNSLVNLGDLNEIVTAQKLGFDFKNYVSISVDDLPTAYRNEIKFTDNQNSKSNKIELTKGAWLCWIDKTTRQHHYEWANREKLRLGRNELDNSGRGGSKFRKAVLGV